VEEEGKEKMNFYGFQSRLRRKVEQSVPTMIIAVIVFWRQYLLSTN